jgi:hypothetical protein
VDSCHKKSNLPFLHHFIPLTSDNELELISKMILELIFNTILEFQLF